MNSSKELIQNYPSIIIHQHTVAFMKGEMPDFESRPYKTSKTKRTSKYKMLGSNNRVTLAVLNSTLIRSKFHNLPIDLPPPSGSYNQLTHEHSYSNCIK